MKLKVSVRYFFVAKLFEKKNTKKFTADIDGEKISKWRTMFLVHHKLNNPLRNSRH